MEPFEVLISRVPGADARDRRAGSLGRRPRRLRPLGPAGCAVIGRVTADGDIAIVDGGAELARIPAAALTSDAIVHERVAAAPVRRRPRPHPARPSAPASTLPERGMDPGAVLVALLGSPNLAEPRRGLRAVRLDRPGEHGRRARPRRLGDPDQGHDEGARGHDRREPGDRRDRSLARRGDERRRGDPQRRRSPGRGRSA